MCSRSRCSVTTARRCGAHAEPGAHLHSVLAAGAGPALNQGVARVNDTTDSVGIGVQLCFEGLVLLVLALKTAKNHLSKPGPALDSFSGRRDSQKEGSGSERKDLG